MSDRSSDHRRRVPSPITVILLSEVESSIIRIVLVIQTTNSRVSSTFVSQREQPEYQHLFCIFYNKLGFGTYFGLIEMLLLLYLFFVQN